MGKSTTAIQHVHNILMFSNTVFEAKSLGCVLLFSNMRVCQHHTLLSKACCLASMFLHFKPLFLPMLFIVHHICAQIPAATLWIFGRSALKCNCTTFFGCCFSPAVVTVHQIPSISLQQQQHREAQRVSRKKGEVWSETRLRDGRRGRRSDYVYI